MRKLLTPAGCSWLIASFVFALSHTSVNAQSSPKILTDISENEITLTGQRYTFPKQYRTLHLNKQAAQQFFSTAPVETPANMKNSAAVFEMPMPDGGSMHFRIWETPVMHPDLAAQFPEIKTYAGQGIDNPNASIRLDMTPKGFHAMVLSPEGSAWIDPYCFNNTDDYICYYKRELPASLNFNCETAGARRGNVDDMHDIIPNNLYAQKVAGAQLRTYRLALACTGEYAATKGGTVTGAMAGIVTSINRVDGVYETEVAIRMTLIANNSSIVYTNSSTDPYTNGNGSTMLGQNQTTCTNVIGSANYDIGHVFSTGGGGVAYLGCVCSSSNKAGGVTGSSNPVGDAYDIDYVAHEMGHQFGGNHTFNSTTGSCGGGNRSASAAFEPGSGITIMAYAGICGADDLAAHSIAYFHTYSFDEIVNYSTTGNGNTCAVTTASGNTPPNVTTQGANYTIPISTPFVLTGAATDADGDPLTYSWEEMDLGTAGGLNVQSTTAPQFTSFSPVSSPSRTFPSLTSIINNTASVGEWLPNQARSLKFRLTARDNKMGGGGVMHPDVNVTLTVVAGGAFAVTAPNTAVSWAGGSSQAVTWSVNGSSGAPISCANVMISLSTDGGNTFPTVLLASTPNDGSENITVPNIASTTARIKVEAVGNIFFDMSNVNFTITGASGLTAISTTSISPLSYCAGTAKNIAFTTTGSANAGNIFTSQLSNSAGSFASPVSIGTLTGTSSGTIAATIPAGTATGSGYRIRVVSSNPVITGSDNGANLTISAQVAAAGSITTAFTSFCANIPITFNTSSIANATTYTWAATGGAAVSSGQGTLSAVIVFPNTITTSTVSVFGTNANCTGTSSTLVVTIMATPNTPTANNASGCSGVPITLTGSPAGGTFSVPNPYTGSSTTFTYNVANGNGCNTTSSPATITVNSNPAPSISGTLSFCSGSSTTLNAGAGYNSYLWSTGATTQTISVSTAGSFGVTVSNANGCTGSTSVTTTVNSNPSPSISGTLSFCSGGSTTLNAGAGYSSYLWSTGATTQTISVSTAGSFGVTVTNANGCTGSTSATTTVNSNPSPSISGTLSFCSGSSATLTASAGFIGYSWSTGATTQAISVSTAGSFSVTVTNANGCTGSTSATSTVNSNPSPSISGTLSFCSGSSTTLTASAGFIGYNWSTGATTQTISVSTGGSFSVTVTNGNGCTGSTSATSTVNSNPSPSISGTLSFCAGGSTTLDGGAGYSSYLWSTGATTQTIAVSTAGSFSVTVTNGNGCTGSTSATTTVNSNPSPSISGTLTFCAGGSTTLDAGAGYSGYYWSTGSTTQSIVVNSGGIVSVTVTNSNGCSSSTSVSVTVNPLPSVSFSGLLSSYDVSAAAATLTGSPVGGAFSGPGISGSTFTASVAGVGGPYTISYSYTDGNGCGNSSSQQTSVTNCTAPAQPGTITVSNGSAKVCPGDSRTYTVAAVSGATIYNWTTPTGATITSGAGTRIVNITYDNNFTTAGTLSVTAGNGCATSIARTLAISRNTPSTPGVISGASSAVCAGNSGTYSVTNVSGLTYNWTAPANASIASGQGTNSVVVNFSALFTSGTLSVTATNTCSTSGARSLSILSKPATPGTISGATGAVCANTSGSYSVTNVNGVTYNWVAPANATITGGQGTNAVTIDFLAAFTSGTLSVTGNNACGASPVRSVSILSAPAMPGAITGPVSGNCNTTSAYSIAPVATALSYSWTCTVPGSVVTPSGTSASVSYPSFTSGSLRVTASNGCGTSTIRSLTVYGTPATPPSITGSATACSGQFGVSYSINPIATASNYTWLVPTGATIFDGVVTSSGNTLTTTSTAVNVNFGTTAGSVSARANNACGSGSYRSLAVVFNCREIANHGSFDFSIYPNPSASSTEINFSSDSDQGYRIRLVSLLGQTVLLNSGIANVGDTKVLLNLESVTRGIYTVEITKGEKVAYNRLVVN